MRLLVVFLCTFICSSAFSQGQPLNYYLPDVSFDSRVPSPEQFLGHEVGEWHVSHDQLRFYMQALAEASPRVTIEEYARSYENRPLQLLTITSPRNHNRISEILAYRDQVGTGEADSTANSDQPVVIYQGYSIHGNEASGANASLLVAYYLAAGQSAEIDAMLDNVVILLDPSFNPDGLQRFSTWVNSHKNYNLTADPNDREYSEAWPRGRTNHYWFDLNRDWLLLQHPESRGRVANFQKWKPNILTDHHEMGTNSSFFFMPGEPTRVNPTTPAENQELTAAIARYHVRELDAIGSLYFSEEGFDDFYYGKGSTYPDANGCIGILFEQGSARGHVQESENGLLTFAFAIRNQVATSISTQRAAVGLKEELMEFQRGFFQENLSLAGQDSILAYAFGAKEDRSRLSAFVDVLLQHNIEVHSVDDDDQDDLTHLVLMNQPQYRMVKAIFDRQVTFEDSLFYDVSGWTLPLAFNVEHEGLTASRFSESLVGERVTSVDPPAGSVRGGRSSYGYIMSWEDYFAPKAAYAIQDAGIRIKVSQLPLTAQTAEGSKEFSRGAIFIPAQNQLISDTEVFLAVVEAAESSGVEIFSLTSGFTTEGPDMGSRNVSALDKPEICLVIGNGASSYEAGELWHLFDQRYDIPVTKITADELGSSDLSRYNVILMASGSYNTISKSDTDQLKEWLRTGGTLVTTRSAMNWASRNGLLKTSRVNSEDANDNPERRPYEMASRDRGGSVVGGAIFEVELDLTHPISFGYTRPTLPVFRRGTNFFKPAENAYATPARYVQEPLLSGYINDSNLSKLPGSASILVGRFGSGQIIGFADNPSFRAYWWGTQKLVANAVFFGQVISSATMEAAPRPKTGE